MPVGLFLDVHVDKAIHDQLRVRGVDVLRAQGDDAAEMADDELLQRASHLGRLIFTQDIRFKVLAEDWQRQARPFAGLVFAQQQQLSVGQLIFQLELVAKVSEPAEWLNRVERLPL